MKKTGLILLTAIFTILLSKPADALSMNPFKREGRTRAHTLMVTGNFVDARLLAELAQHRTKQPIILLSPDGFQNYQLFFMPPGDKAVVEPSDNFLSLVDFINPRRIVILGDVNYVPQTFIDKAREKHTVFVLNSSDWSKNADALGDLLKQPKLTRLYEDYRKRLHETNNPDKQ
ncbi:MAG: hypothetical protein J6X49_05020 [Victivallales bacterium]|nr:hypothetical protein [Victivallales bacterium]